MPKFAANLSFLYTELPFLDRFEAAAKDGFKAVEFLFPYAYPAHDIAARLKANDLQQVLFNLPPGGVDAKSIEHAWTKGERGIACQTGREAEFAEGLDLALRYADALGSARLHLMAGIVPNGVSIQNAHQTYVTNAKTASKLTASRNSGVTITIEPINTFDMPGYFLTHQAQAHALLAEIGASNVKVQMDLYHCQRMEGHVNDVLRQYLPSGNIAHIQIASSPHRHEPQINHVQSGDINYAAVFDFLDSMGYEGWIGCEYKPQLQGQNLGPTSATSMGLDWFKPYRTTQR
ncbi:MAG TPA: hydroxypyruvate isomerase family protein [Burkholderiaceae bacterium]|nr:hydroxypyruvate isomerase family protein [Burkholderiaceae bacterium]